MQTCKHALVDLSISFPREITASIVGDPVDDDVVDLVAANRQTYGVGPGRLKIKCRQCGREDYWTADRPDTWPMWARRRFMRVARTCPELISWMHALDKSHLLNSL